MLSRDLRLAHDLQSVTIEFWNFGNGSHINLDNIRIEAIPEPSVIALMTVALALFVARVSGVAQVLSEAIANARRMYR